jgi:hypothetical protein
METTRFHRAARRRGGRMAFVARPQQAAIVLRVFSKG